MEAEILQSMGVDFVDESEVLTPADETRHVNKRHFKVPFVCGARNLGEALRRIEEGAAMIRTKGEAGTGNIVNAVTHMRAINEAIAKLNGLDEHQMAQAASQMGVPVALVKETRDLNRLPLVNFAAGGIATPADAGLMMALGSDGVFVGSGIFKSENPAKMAHAIVQAVIHYQDPAKLVDISKGLGTAMIGLENHALDVRMAERGQ
jgi:pyridoxal 5'-phosphate synthase pdxS subunit